MIRPGTPQDARFLRDMLRHAYYWRERAPRDPMEGSVQRYVMSWGRAGDAAVIAYDEAGNVGAAWYRLFKEKEPGYGFVDEQTPELSIAVVPSRRGHGFGGEPYMVRRRWDYFVKYLLGAEPPREYQMQPTPNGAAR